MANKKNNETPAWLASLEAKDTPAVRKSTQASYGGSGTSSQYKQPAGLGVDIRQSPELSVFNNNQANGTTTYNGSGLTTYNMLQPAGNGTASYNGNGTTTYSPTATTTYTPPATTNYTPGNYTIGSDYGKQRARDMAIGSYWTATDGSTWYKENDGTITVYHGDTISKNAYAPTDLGIVLQQQIAAGVPRQYVNATLNSRVNKAMGSEELNQYAYDNVYWDAVNYIRNQMLAENQETFIKPEQLLNQSKPTYEDQYDPQIQELLNQILSREDFSYNAKTDPLYQQYASMYQREGDRAMRDTMAEAAAGAGGMNSYAITAAQQASNYYASQLNDKIPELYQLAYQMYLDDKESDVQNLGILQNLSDRDYNRYRGTMEDYYADRNFAYNMYRDDVADGQWQTQFDYNAMNDDRNFNYGVSQDFLSNAWREREWNRIQEESEYEKGQYEDDKAYERAQAEKKDAYNLVVDAVANGASLASIGATLIQKAGLSEAVVKDWITKRDSGNFSQASSRNGGGSSRSSSSRSSSSSGYSYSGNSSSSNKNNSSSSSSDKGWVRVSGAGRMSYAEVSAGLANGTITATTRNGNTTYTYHPKR